MDTSKMWGSYAIDPTIETFTKGDDIMLDSLLLPYDITATTAHVSMLANIGAITKQECSTLTAALQELSQTVTAKGFVITNTFEDGHSFIEHHLTKHCGKAGKKVHFLRSRNDQSLVMLRLFMLDVSRQVSATTASLATLLHTQATRHNNQPMPGYTHMQKAMPATVGMWLGSYADALTDTLPLLNTTIQTVDQNPLGSGAGFGFIGQTVQPNTNHTTKQLGFSKTQSNPMYCGMSRGYFEFLVLQALSPISLLASQFASDCLLFSMDEFGFITLPHNFTTGSSIMPQKRNYDVLEIMRGKDEIIRGYMHQIHGIIAKKTNGYQRDLQLTKKPFVEAILALRELTNVWLLVAHDIRVGATALNKAMSPQLFATAQANNLVTNGVPFRDAYLHVKQSLLIAP